VPKKKLPGMGGGGGGDSLTIALAPASNLQFPYEKDATHAAGMSHATKCTLLFQRI